jgi:signal transduction histidine kinase
MKSSAGHQDEIADLDGVRRMEHRFMNHIFHDFKGAISTALMCLGAIQAGVWGPVNERQNLWLSKAERNLDRLINLINNYRDLLLVSEGSFPATPVEVDLLATAGALRRRIEECSVERGIKPVFHFPEHLPKTVFATDLFERVLHNLSDIVLMNTVEKGRIAARIECGEGEFRLELSFEAVTFDGEMLQTCLDRSAQAEAGLKLGRGYTLLFCKEAVTLMGGRLVLSPWRDIGAIVEIALPLNEAGQARSAEVK